VIGMVGLIEDVRRTIQPGFKNEGDLIALLGTTQDDLSMSEYAVSVGGATTTEIVATGRVPALDLEREKAVQNACLEAAEAGLLVSAHDCSDGGLAVALAESCFSSLGRDGIGAQVDLEGTLSPTSLLFSESPSRIIISFTEAVADEIQQIAARHNAPFKIIGRVGGASLRVVVNEQAVLNTDLTDLESTWRNGLSRKLQAEVVPTV
ncbi:MAG TPA: AIR synthase-related protein, partial [Pyrinomonadaceae bacterium]|nr:AIR synthase-related protein [Pyrinomonadaceae bacterium]